MGLVPLMERRQTGYTLSMLEKPSRRIRLRAGSGQDLDAEEEEIFSNLVESVLTTTLYKGRLP